VLRWIAAHGRRRNTREYNKSPPVGELLAAIEGEMGREALQSTLGLSDRKSFRARYLKSALAEGLIEMTIPDKPNSRLHRLPP
jgi:hypothetical protein